MVVCAEAWCTTALSCWGDYMVMVGGCRHLMAKLGLCQGTAGVSDGGGGVMYRTQERTGCWAGWWVMGHGGRVDSCGLDQGFYS